MEETTPTTEGELTGTRILVVDDSQDSLDMMRLLLNGKGAMVEAVLSGEAGLRAAMKKARRRGSNARHNMKKRWA